MSEKLRRVCFYAGPGAGKTTTASRVFADLKRDGKNVEYAPEHVKSWTYIPRTPGKWDQPLLFGQQINYTLLPLNNGVDVVVEESPPQMNAWYAEYFESGFAKELMDISWQFDDEYPGLHIFLEREDAHFQDIGRFQNLEESKRMDERIYGMLNSRLVGTDRLMAYSINDYEAMLETILQRIS